MDMSGLEIDTRNAHGNTQGFNVGAHRLDKRGKNAKGRVGGFARLFQEGLGESITAQRCVVLRVCLVSLVEGEATDLKTGAGDLCSRVGGVESSKKN